MYVFTTHTHIHMFWKYGTTFYDFTPPPSTHSTAHNQSNLQSNCVLDDFNIHMSFFWCVTSWQKWLMFILMSWLTEGPIKNMVKTTINYCDGSFSFRTLWEESLQYEDVTEVMAIVDKRWAMAMTVLANTRLPNKNTAFLKVMLTWRMV